MGDSWTWAGYLYQEDEMTHTEGPSYQEMKIAERGYPGISSQQDVITAKAADPGMYRTTIESPGGKGASGTVSAGAWLYTDIDKVIAVTQQPAVWAERLSNNSARLEFENIPNDQAMRIVVEVLPRVMELYMKKSKDYGGNVMSMLKLGPKASFVDLWRKVGKLKRCLWDGESMQGEQTDEILKDCVGHILITLDEMREDHG